MDGPAGICPDLLRTIDACGDPAFVVDERWAIVRWNDAAAAVFHRTSADALGRPCYEVVGGVDDAGRQVCRLHCEKWALVRRGARVHNFDVRALTDHGIWANVSILPVADPAGRPVALVHVLRSMNRTKRLEAFVRQLATSAEDVLTSRAGNGTVDGLSVHLTLREAEVLGLLAHGAGTATIADRLGVSRHTVHNHIAVILNKLGVHNRAEAVAYAFEHHLA